MSRDIKPEKLKEPLSSISPEDWKTVKEESDKLLRYWIQLARVRDESGLPVDLIYEHCRINERLPQMIDRGEVRAVTEQEFTDGIKDCVAILQGRSPKGMDLDQSRLQIIRSQIIWDGQAQLEIKN